MTKKVSGPSFKFGWTVFTSLIFIVSGYVAVNAQTGVYGTVRGKNLPTADAVNSASNDLLSSLLSPFMLGPTLFALTVFGVLLGLSWRKRKLQPVAIVAIATLFTGFIDPIANWATFAILNPEIPHFPLTWPWFNLAPLIEPVSAFLGGYSAYYMLVSLSIFWLSKQLLLKIELNRKCLQRRPTLLFFLTAFAVSIPLNLLLQLAWMHFDVLVYTQCFGPLLSIGDLQYPILIVLYDPFVYATIATLCLKNKQGTSRVLIKIARNLTKNTNPGSSTQTAIAIVLVWASILLPISFFAGVRVAGLANKPAYEEFPFPSAKIYDPYGDLERAGKAGPFYR